MTGSPRRRLTPRELFGLLRAPIRDHAHLFRTHDGNVRPLEYRLVILDERDQEVSTITVDYDPDRDEFLAPR